MVNNKGKPVSRSRVHALTKLFTAEIDTRRTELRMKINSNIIPTSTKERLTLTARRTDLPLEDLVAHAVICGANSAVRLAERGGIKSRKSYEPGTVREWFDDRIEITGDKDHVLDKEMLFADYMTWLDARADSADSYVEAISQDGFVRALTEEAERSEGRWQPSERRRVWDDYEGKSKIRRAAVGIMFKEYL